MTEAARKRFSHPYLVRGAFSRYMCLSPLKLAFAEVPYEGTG